MQKKRSKTRMIEGLSRFYYTHCVIVYHSTLMVFNYYINNKLAFQNLLSHVAFNAACKGKITINSCNIAR